MCIDKLKILCVVILQLGLLCLVGCSDNLRDGVTAYKAKEFEKAMRKLAPVAELGGAEAQLFIGFMYDNGEGVKQDYALAAAWYGKAADQGEPVAQYNLGMLYWNGLGVRQDSVQALKLFNLAASSGSTKAIAIRKEAMQSMTAEQIKQAEDLVEQWIKQHG